MLSVANDFFEICKVKIELEFINKIKYFDKYEKIKNCLKNNFSEFLINIDLEKLKQESEVNSKQDASKNPEAKSLNIVQAYLYEEQNVEIIKYLNGRMFFNKFFELSDIKNRYESKKYNT